MSEEANTANAPAQARAAALTILLGFNGTGKTTLLRYLLQASGQKVLVVTPDDAEWTDCPLTELSKPADFVYRGIRRHIFDPETTLDALDKFKRGILVFDDCRAYFQDHTDPRVRALLIRRRQREVDVFAVGHGFTQVPPVFFTFATMYILFKTVDNVERRKNCIQNFELVKQTQAEVNRRAKSEPHFFKIINT